MAYRNFFSDFVSLEKQYFRENSQDIPSEQSLRTYSMMKSFLYGFSWTKSENTKFIVKNMHLSCDEMARKYNAQVGGSGKKEKCSSTFRVQKAAASKFLYSIFGEDYRDAFYAQDLEEHKIQDKKLRRIQVTIELLEGDYKDRYALVIPDLGLDIGTDDAYDLKDCESEILFLSKYMKLRVEEEISKLDPDKLSFLFSILNEGIFSDNTLNNKKLDLLNRMTLQLESRRQISKHVQKVESIQRVEPMHERESDKVIQPAKTAFTETSIDDDDLYGNVLQ